MTNPAFHMTYLEKQERHSQKRACLLQFLASGEVYTTLKVAAQLLQASERTTLRLLQKLVEEKLLKVDLKVMPHTSLKLFGISEFGLAMTETANLKAKPFMLSRTNPSWVQHHVDGQLIRIKAEVQGWKNYLPGKLLMVENTARLKKLPDALITRPDGRKVAIEIERYVKSRKRMEDVIAAHLSQIVDKKYDFVYYFTPHKPALDRAFAAVQFVAMDTKKIQLNDTHRARFKTFDLQKWNGEM